jgi:acyl-homoserine lactone acylase PvdQ
LPQFEGSNAWAISGSRTKSGKPLLAGDPHIRFSVPSVWYEAHLSAPGFELYGYQRWCRWRSWGTTWIRLEPDHVPER